MPEMTLIDAVREAMDEELARDERVFITGEDVGPRGGVFRALYRYVEAEVALRPDVCGLRLYVERDNAITQRTYEALGMTRAGYAFYERKLA